MIKLLYVLAKAIPALQKILDKLFGEGRVLSASKRLEAKDSMVEDAIADALASHNERVRGNETEQQRTVDETSGV